MLRPAGRSNLSAAAFHIFRYYNLHVKKGNEDLTVIEKLIRADLKRKKRSFLLPVGKCNIRDAKCSQSHIVFYFSVQPEKKKKHVQVILRETLASFSTHSHEQKNGICSSSFHVIIFSD